MKGRLFAHVDAYTQCMNTCTHAHTHRFHATLYQCPETTAERQEMTIAVANRINDLQSVLQTTEEHSVTQLTDIARKLDTWQTKVDV